MRTSIPLDRTEAHAIAFEARKKSVPRPKIVQLRKAIPGSTERLGERVFDEQLISGEARFALAHSDWMLDFR